MIPFSSGFKGYEQAEDIHGQIRLCKENNKNMLHLKNMNFCLACDYNENQARQVKKLLDREGVGALSLFVFASSDEEKCLKLASVYKAEYIVCENDETKERFKNLTDSFTVITDGEL